MITKLYAGNIAYSATKEDLANLFSKAGKVLASRIIQDHGKAISRGFGFVEMASEAQAQKAIEDFNGYILLGRPLLVHLAHDDKEQSRRIRQSKQNIISDKQ